MSGIGAIFNRSGRPVREDDLAALAQGLRPYGRERQWYKALGPCGLVYAHMSNTPQCVAERQPVADQSGTLHLVFDGRFDNREELIDALGLSQADAATWPDSRLALSCWDRWGAEAPERWVGEFAVLVWNAKAQSLVAVRDHLGQRALSYHVTPDRMVIASAPRALFTLPDVPKEIDRQKMADALVQMFHDGARSFFRDISRVEIAHRMSVTRTSLSTEKYWSLDAVPDVRLSSDEAYVEAARELLDQSVNACLRRTGRIGAFMSGGLDASTVAVTALSHLHDQDMLPTFTWVPQSDWDGRCPPGAYGDERPFVEAIAAMHPRLEPHFVTSEGHGLFYQLDEFLDYAGVAPRNAINLCWFHDIHLEARAKGISVLLEGGAGNMSLSSDGRALFVELWREKKLRRIVAELFAGGFNPRSYAYRFVKLLLLPLAPDAVNTAYLRLRGHLDDKPIWSRGSAINPEFARRMNVDERMEDFGWDFWAKPVRDSREYRSRFLTASFWNEKADIDQAFRALYGIESRDPLADRRLVEFCVGIPEAQSCRNGQSRWLARRLLQGLLPDLVLYNNLVGAQVSDWHARMTRDLPKIREELSAISDDPDTAEFIDVQRIRGILDRWPKETPLEPMPGHHYSYIPVSVGAALAAGRFVRRVKGSNR